MRVKVGNTWYEATVDQPIMVEVDAFDKDQIAGLPSNRTQYACFHDDDRRTPEEMRAWMVADADA